MVCHPFIRNHWLLSADQVCVWGVKGGDEAGRSARGRCSCPGEKSGRLGWRYAGATWLVGFWTGIADVSRKGVLP